MKLTSLVLGLALSTSAFADGISFDKDKATITGSLKSTSAEVFEFIAKAYEHGFKDANGADFFNKVAQTQGMRSYTAFVNKNVKSSQDSAFALIYKLELNGKDGDIEVSSDRHSVTVKGRPAVMLMGALSTVYNIDNRGPVGIGRVSTKSGKVVCMKVVAPSAVPTCTLKL